MMSPRILTIGGVSIAGLVGLVVSLVIGGAATESLLADPGVLVRFGTPASKLAVSASMALLLGGLAVKLFALPPGKAADRVHSLALGSSITLSFAMVAYSSLTFLTVFAAPVTLDPGFEASLRYFIVDTDLGRLLVIVTGLSLVVTVILALAHSFWWSATAFALSVAMVWPFGEMSHSGGTDNHGIAVSALVLHIIFVSLWSGGLLATVVSMASGADREATMRRYSSIALLSISIVAITGIASSVVRIGSWENIDSGYGIIVALKAAITVIAGLLGARWRKSIIPTISQRRGVAAFAIVETALLAVALGLATGLGRTATPADDTFPADPTPAEILLGRPLPAPWSWETAFTEWRIDLIWLLFAVFSTVFYLWGVARLTRRGDTWPIHRSVSWIIGMAVLVYATSGGVAVYGEFLFSAHMIAHMVLTMLIPVTIVMAAPVTLVARAVESRPDGSRGMREWILGIVQSRWVGFVGHPLISTVVFAMSLIVFYYSPLLGWATTTHLGHQWMVVHFLLTGYLFVQALISVDPSPHRTPYPMRLLLLMGTMGFHAFFGLSLMTGTGLLLPEWFGAMGREWGDTPIVDQQIGGAIAWGIGELPTLVLSGLVILSWIRSDEREARRRDRQANRDGDAELNAYNAMLDRVSSRDEN
ncbi:MAG: copper transporter [Actinobacteria bacterium]|nr:copper transporter [Actinomycetota bacterium]